MSQIKPAPKPLKDSGHRVQHQTGAVREMAVEKGKSSLISPWAIHRLAVHSQRGAEKYLPRNWEQGLPMSSFLDSMDNHRQAYLAGDRSEDHPAAMMWNAMALLHTEEMVNRGLLPAELNDLPDYTGGTGVWNP